MHPHYKHHQFLLAASVTMIFIIASLVAMLALHIDPFQRKEPKYLKEEEAVIEIENTKEETSSTTTPTAVIIPIEKVLFEYIEVIDGCGIHFDGLCLNVRSGPGEDYPSVAKLRNGIVLKVGGKVERDGHTWYKIVFDEKLRYPERITTDWYVAADYVRILLDEGTRNFKDAGGAISAKRIIIDRSKQTLYAYDGDVLFMQELISTGLELTPTPRGVFTIFKKTPSRYMQGPVPDLSDQYYDLPGVPWDLYFTSDGAVIHGAYWHDNFGKQSSHGCVNLPPKQAEKLYNWAEIGMPVTVRD